MKLLLTIALAACCFQASAHSRAVYRKIEVPVSSSAPCFVHFQGYELNANMIAMIAIGRWTELSSQQGLRVELINGLAIMDETGNLEAKKAVIMAAVKACAK